MIAQDTQALGFIRGDGEMKELIHTKEWAATSIGTPDSWPNSLRTILGVILNSKFPCSFGGE